jgi:nucleotide-binding universal stress UspA family protein
VGEVGELVRFAKMFKASIDIFHVFPSFPQWVDPSEENIAALTAKLHAAYPGQKFNIQVVQTYKENDVVTGIETFVKSFKPDVLAMFTVKRTFWDKLFDASRTEEFAFNATIPLLTLKKK